MLSQATRTRETIDLSELVIFLDEAVDERLAAPDLSRLNLSKHAV